MSILETLLLFVILQVAWTLLIRTFPDFLGAALLKGVERRNTIEIEKLKNGLTHETQKEIEHLKADYATLKSSTDYLSANQSELRSKMIEATELLWTSMLSIQKTFGDVMFLETAFLPSELEAAFSGGDRHDLVTACNKYADESHVTSKLMQHGQDHFSKQRLFVGDRVWLIYYAFSALHFRTGMLIHRSFKTSIYNNWREDNVIRQLLISVLGEERVKPLYTDPLPMISRVVAELEAEFLRESMRTMSGSKFFADSITDVRATLQYETGRTRESVEKRGIKTESKTT